jgi:hypothetical protein
VVARQLPPLATPAASSEMRNQHRRDRAEGNGRRRAAYRSTPLAAKVPPPASLRWRRIALVHTLWNQRSRTESDERRTRDRPERGARSTQQPETQCRRDLSRSVRRGCGYHHRRGPDTDRLWGEIALG